MRFTLGHLAGDRRGHQLAHGIGIVRVHAQRPTQFDVGDLGQHVGQRHHTQLQDLPARLVHVHLDETPQRLERHVHVDTRGMGPL